MTALTQAVTVSHPPFLVLRLANPVLDLLLKNGISTSLSRNYANISFTGCKSGQIYKFPIRMHRIDGDLYAVTSARWRLNFREDAPAQIMIDGATDKYRGELIEDPDLVAALLSRLTHDYGPKIAQHKLALKFHTDAPSRQDFREAAHYEHIGAIRFVPA